MIYPFSEQDFRVATLINLSELQFILNADSFFVYLKESTFESIQKRTFHGRFRLMNYEVVYNNILNLKAKAIIHILIRLIDQFKYAN